jgi:hypothetical protein
MHFDALQAVALDFYLEIVRGRVRFNLGEIWPNLATWGLHRRYSYMITNTHAKFELKRPNFRDLTRVCRYRFGA